MEKLRACTSRFASLSAFDSGQMECQFSGLQKSKSRSSCEHGISRGSRADYSAAVSLEKFRIKSHSKSLQKPEKTFCATKLKIPLGEVNELCIPSLRKLSWLREVQRGVSWEKYLANESPSTATWQSKCLQSALVSDPKSSINGAVKI